MDALGPVVGTSTHLDESGEIVVRELHAGEVYVDPGAPGGDQSVTIDPRYLPSVSGYWLCFHAGADLWPVSSEIKGFRITS